jgi:competence ComEA-like helix-hairpin-helix protein
LKRINLNTASLDELKAHPYIRYTLANAIVQFRAAHGKFSAVSDIRKILVVTDEVYNKLEAYLVAE